MKYEYVCKFCGEKFYCPAHLSNHYMEKHYDKLKYECNICRKRFADYDGLWSHKKYVHGPKKKKKCPICGKFIVKIKEHIKRHQKNYKCYLCQQIFASRGRLETHMRKEHFLDRKYKCSICGKELGSRGAKNNHEKLHKVFYTCKICGRVFNKKWTRDEHVKYVHEKKGVYVTCEVCGAKIQKRLYKRHLHTMHEGVPRERIKNYHCPLCEKKYKQLSDLTKHLFANHGLIPDDALLFNGSTKFAGPKMEAKGIFRYQCVKCGEWLHRRYRGPDGDLCVKCKKKYTKRRLTTGKLYI